MMVIFVKYEKPMEDDMEKLIQIKLIEVFENQLAPESISEET